VCTLLTRGVCTSKLPYAAHRSVCWKCTLLTRGVCTSKLPYAAHQSVCTLLTRGVCTSKLPYAAHRYVCMIMFQTVQSNCHSTFQLKCSFHYKYLKFEPFVGLFDPFCTYTRHHLNYMHAFPVWTMYYVQYMYIHLK